MVNKKNYTFDVYFNPLSLYEIDYAQQVEEELSETAIIRFLSSPGADNSLENLRLRYLQNQ